VERVSYDSLHHPALPRWPPPEFGQNLDTKNMGKLGLTPEEVILIVECLEAVSGGWVRGG
jgi:hypothetical protein